MASSFSSPSSGDPGDGNSGAVSRGTHVVVVTLETNEVYIIISLSTRKDTQVIYIDPTTGSLCYIGKQGHDLFITINEALHCITEGSRLQYKITPASAILGYSVLGSLGLLLVATKVNITVPNLPGGGHIMTVAESQWIKIPLQYPQPQGKVEAKNIQDLAELDIDGKHYFCETRDITRPFPSGQNLQEPDPEFVWNAWFSKSFKDIGLPEHCVVLLQGFAESRNFGGVGSKDGMVALVARRSRLHPGTRYLARGLNACCSTGNEVECEQIVWVPLSGGQNVQFSRYVWRRGTIPMWWGAEVKLAVEAEIYVSEKEPYSGSLQYYQRLSKRYCAQVPELSSSKQKKMQTVPIICINLLRNGEGKSESLLVKNFDESIRHVRSTGKLANTMIQLINYDWHAEVKSKGEQLTVQGLWNRLKAPSMAIGLSEGNYFFAEKQLKDSIGFTISNDDIRGGFLMTALQNGVIRFNCADSLDRTNAASFFGSVQVFVEQCRRLGIPHDVDVGFGLSSVNRYTEYSINKADLPPGWEERFDSVTGKPFYIDHNTRRTTWQRPNMDKPPDKPWKRFDLSFDQFKMSTLLGPINQLAELFLLAGDIHATLYTGSKAMHSQILSIFKEESGKFSKFSAAQNVKITLQRRYQNVIVDSSRQKQLEMFLGLRLFKHLPSIPVHPLKVPSRPPGCILKPVPSISPSADGGSCLLNYKKKDLVWVCPLGVDVVEVFLYLGEPCHICQLLLTVCNTADAWSYPATVDVRVGNSLDELKLVLEGACIPQCSNGTNILIPLSGKINPKDLAVTGKSAQSHAYENSYLPLLYDFEELEGELDFLNRVVALTFYPSVSGRTSITLSQIEILGVSLPWAGIFNNSPFAAELISLLQESLKNESHLQQKLSLKEPSNPFLGDIPSSYDQNHTFGNHSTTLSAQSSSSVFDFLTGDFVVTNQPESASEAPSIFSFDTSLDGIFDNYLDDNNVLPSASSVSNTRSNDLSEERSGAELYISLYRSIVDSNHGSKPNFEQALQLEIDRLKLNLSSAERDRALLSISVDPAAIDPNRLVSYSDLTELKSSVDSLANLGNTYAEDQINASIGLEPVNNGMIDFWNINNLSQSCVGGKCELRAGMLSEASVTASGVDNSSFLKCSECSRTVCISCCAGRGAFLFLNNKYNDMRTYSGLSTQDGSSRGSQGGGSTPYFLTDGILCKKCCGKDVIHALYVDYIRVQCSMRRRSRADNAAVKALNQVIKNKTCIAHNKLRSQLCEKQLKKLLNGAESLAEFPSSSFLYKVETAQQSEPLLSLLAPLFVGEEKAYWSSPPNVNSVEFSIVLGSVSDVSGVILLVSSCGYSNSDCPIIEVSVSNKIHREQRSFVGKWDVKSLAESSPQLCGSEKMSGSTDVPRHMKFMFPNSVRCHLIWIKFTIPHLGANSNKITQHFDLLQLDDNPFSEPKSSSLHLMDTRPPCIHAKRIIVLGKCLRRDGGTDMSMGTPEIMQMRSLSNRPPQLGRFRIPAEERLTDNDLVLEQHLSSFAPEISGFRLDYFNVIRPRVTHSPSFKFSGKEGSVTHLEDRLISPAAIYIKVSAIQEGQNFVTVGEYRLPEVKAKTPLYFDFAQPLQARVVIFRITGDVTAFADDSNESENLPLAAGLCPLNRIMLYQYADTAEMGKIASFSTI